MSKCYYMGIEGGGTRTTGVLADDEMNVVARHVAGPANIHSIGEAAASATLVEVFSGLFGQCAPEQHPILAIALCMAGLRGAADRETWLQIVKDIGVTCAIVLTHDATAGLSAGSPDNSGILVVCGTGSLVFGRRDDGDECSVGGRGPLLGDDGSGYDIARSGLRAALGSFDRSSPQSMLDMLIPEHLGLGRIDDLIDWISPWAKDRIAAVAPVVFEAACLGDAVANVIILRAADDIARCVETVSRRLWAPPDTPKRVVLSGGVIANQPGFRDAIADRVAKFLPGVECIEPEVDGAVGAARMARRLHISLDKPGPPDKA